MTTPNLDQHIPSHSSAVKRVFIALGGLILLAVGAVITLGSELVGVAAIIGAWFLMRRRKRRLTRTRAWFVSVIATAIPLVVLFAVSVMSVPTVTPEQRKTNMAEARARTRDSMPELLKKLMPPQQRTQAVADSITEKLLENKGFRVWMGAMGALIASGMAGLFAGTIAWAATMLLFRAFTDEWMGAVAEPPTAAAEV
jgi:hypothetical protein